MLKAVGSVAQALDVKDIPKSLKVHKPIYRLFLCVMTLSGLTSLANYCGLKRWARFHGLNAFNLQFEAGWKLFGYQIAGGLFIALWSLLLCSAIFLALWFFPVKILLTCFPWYAFNNIALYKCLSANDCMQGILLQ